MSETSKHSLSLNKLLIESLSDGILCLDKSLRCTLINSSALKILGYAEGYCVGKNIHDFIQIQHENGECCLAGECLICKAVNYNESSVVADGKFWNANGSLINVRYTTNPIVANGKIIGVNVLFSTDYGHMPLAESK